MERKDWEEGWEKKKGSIRLLCSFVLLQPFLLPPPPSLYDSLFLSLSLLICFCAERKGTCRSLMIQPFSCSTDKTACPSCHCSAWLSCPLHYNYCSCSRPVTSTLPLLPKCSGEWALLFNHCSPLDHAEHLRNLNLWQSFFVFACSKFTDSIYRLMIVFPVRKHEQGTPFRFAQKAVYISSSLLARFDSLWRAFLLLKSQLEICGLMMENILVETDGRQPLCDALS